MGELRRPITGTLMVAFLFASGVADAQGRSGGSGAATARIVDDLEIDTERLAEEAELFLERSRRWRPVGVDADFWNAARALEDGADLLRYANRFGARAGTQREVRDLLEHGATFERLLDHVRPNRSLHDGWRRVRSGLVRLARAWGYDYERDYLAALAPGRGTRSVSPTREPNPVGRGAQSLRGSRYSAADRETVAAALQRVEQLADLLSSRVRYAGVSDTSNPIQGLGESLLREAARSAGVQDPRRARLEANVTAFLTTAREARTKFRKDRDLGQVQPSVASLLRQASELQSSLRLSPSGREVEQTWGDLHTELDRLARVFDLMPLPAQR